MSSGSALIVCLIRGFPYEQEVPSLQVPQHQGPANRMLRALSHLQRKAGSEDELGPSSAWSQIVGGYAVVP